MFGVQFYPTPETVIYKMLEGTEYRNKHILDPGAGRGDILDLIYRLVQHDYGRHNTHLYAIEIDPDLRQVLAGKNYIKVIDTDFLAYDGHRFFDLILMNPPFQDGVKHLLKAWDIGQGAIIKCLLNANSVKLPRPGEQASFLNGNQQTADQKRLAHLIEKHGKVEWLGQPFREADRTTPVEVALVTLQDTKRETWRIDFDPARIGQSGFDLDDISDRELASTNIFENYEARYNAALNAFKELLAANQKVVYYLTGLIDTGYNRPAEIVSDAVKKGSPDLAYTEFLDVVTKKAWDSMFTKTKLSNVTTEGVREQIEREQARQGVMAFTAQNMEDLFFTLAINTEHVMVQCVLEAFDMLTKHYDENRIAVEGWKTNSAYRVGKFILPHMKSYYGDYLDYREIRKLDDLEKALCFVSGKRFEHILHLRDVYERQHYFGEWKTSEFFESKLFKKGTMHFKWRDEDLCKEFNALVARHRWGWVPEKTKQGVYK